MRRRNFILCFVLLFIINNFSLNHESKASDSFLTGWWVDVDQSHLIPEFSSKKHNLVLANFGGRFSFPDYGHNTIKSFLDTAHNYGIKVILGVNPIWEVDKDRFVETINIFKTHPSLYAWFICDEPELINWIPLYQLIGYNPGYYHLIKENDPLHPVFISFWTPFKKESFDIIRKWYDMTDIIGIHSYCSYSGQKEFASPDIWYNYEVWKQLINDCHNYNKDSCIATVQGFGNYNPYNDIYRSPTLKELRWQVYSAVVLGIKRVLFWNYYVWGERDPILVEHVNQIVAELQSIGKQMNEGNTNDKNIIINQLADDITYRYGNFNGTHVILAVNHSKYELGGKYIDEVKFTLPSNIMASYVEVIGENRKIPIINNSFIDSFEPFEVHIYKIYNNNNLKNNRNKFIRKPTLKRGHKTRSASAHLMGRFPEAVGSRNSVDLYRLEKW
jgi:hypothetical protein